MNLTQISWIPFFITRTRANFVIIAEVFAGFYFCGVLLSMSALSNTFPSEIEVANDQTRFNSHLYQLIPTNTNIIRRQHEHQRLCAIVIYYDFRGFFWQVFSSALKLIEME